MGGLNLGKKVRMELENVKGNGLVPSDFEKRTCLPWGRAIKLIQRWEQDGKIICIEKNASPYISRYVLTKYFSENII